MYEIHYVEMKLTDVSSQLCIVIYETGNNRGCEEVLGTYGQKYTQTASSERAEESPKPVVPIVV